MTRRVGKKNIEPMVVDVRRPDVNYRASSRFVRVNLKLPEYVSTPVRHNGKKWLRIGAMVTGTVFVVIIGTFVVRLTGMRTSLAQQGDMISQNFVTSLNALKEFRVADAIVPLEQNERTLEQVQGLFSGVPENLGLQAASSIIPVLKEASTFLKHIATFNLHLLQLSKGLNELQGNAFAYFREDGEQLLTELRTIRDLVNVLKGDVEKLRNVAVSLERFTALGNIGRLIEDNYVAYGTDIYVLNDFLDGLISFLDSEEETHVLLMFQNSSELRPAGGFLGSYGDLVIQRGQMQRLEVQDIFWPDHPMNFTEKLIPPEPLQRTTKDWGARDANWFFDFPTSAEAVMTLLESSKIYKDDDIVFAGAIGLNIEVLGTMLAVIGPVEFEAYEMTIDADNFLAELQREIETGRDKKAGENPKRILSVLAPEIMERLGTIPASRMEQFIGTIGEHIARKDIMFVMRESRMAHTLRRYGVDGSVYDLSTSFIGGYLAIVHANVAGGKTDAVMEEEIEVWFEVATDGSSVGDVTIRRTHTGEDEEDIWYRATNKDYIKIFTNPNSELIFLKGNDVRRTIRNEYGDSYRTYNAFAPIADSRIFLNAYDTWSTEEFGKRVFGTWLLTDAGEESELRLRYRIPRGEQTKLTSGSTYQFIFERQSGTHPYLRITISAPLGYVWRESGAPVYVYETDDPRAREVFTLTLKRQFEEEFIGE